MADATLPNDMCVAEDDRPVAVRRKRRIGTALADDIPNASVQKSEDDTDQPLQIAKTPTKLKKKVRFSEPTPEVSSSTFSTGLTPYVKRTSLTPRLRGASPSTPLLIAGAPRRLSLPTQLTASLPSPSLSPSPTPLTGEIQFEPLRQVLDARLKRRLRRNKLSEETNAFEEDRKSRAKWEQEIHDLKAELAIVKQSRSKEHSEGKDVAHASEDEIQILGQGPQAMRGETREDAVIVEAAYPNAALPTEDAGDIEIYVDTNGDNFSVFNGGENNDVPELSAGAGSSNAVEAGIQVSVPTSSHTETLREARLNLEYLFPGEISLGLIPEDPKPLLDVMIQRLTDLKAEVMIAEDALSTTQTQESNMRVQFNAVLEQLERARKYAASISKQNNSDKSRADTSQARVQVLENTVQAAAKKVNTMEKEGQEKDRSIKKLQEALESYREEVSKLESLITKVENEHGAAMSGLKAEMDEAVADLECHVVAETRGRREAEREIEQRDVMIGELKIRESELQNAVHEKQQIIREAERIFEAERLGREQEVGSLNAQLGHLSSDLSESNAKVFNSEEKQKILMRKLEEERDAGLRAVEAVQAELARCTDKAEEVRTTHVNDVQRRGAEVTQHQGLLTPISATRFKDVEGYVEVRRGKGRKRPDSGIVILEEDEDTIMADDIGEM